MSTIRKMYTKEFKRETVALMEESGNKSQMARDLGNPVSSLGK